MAKYHRLNPHATYVDWYQGSKSSVQTSVPPPTSLRADIPQATVGGAIPYVIGRRRISQPNVIGYGNLRALTQTTVETKTETRTIPGYYQGAIYNPPQIVEETITTETTVPIGFLTDITVGICLGPDVVLKAIYAGTEPIWTGTAGPARTEFTIGVNETAFSECEVAFNGGAFDQDVDPWTSAPPIEPSLPGSLTAGTGINNTHEANPQYVGVISPGATPIAYPPVPETFGSISASVNLFEVVNIYDMHQTGGSGTWNFGSILQVRGDRRVSHPTLNVSLNGGTPITLNVAGFHPQSNTTSYTMPIPQKFGFVPGNTYDIAISPDGPGLPKDSPAYVGIAYIILRGMRADMSIDALSFEVERFPNPLGLTSGQNRKDDDINCATAIYDVLTSDWGGAGIPAENVDEPLLKAAALVFAAEANYCAMLIDAETSATAVLGSLQAQTYSVVYQNPGTGKIEVRPIRQTFNRANIKSFGQNNLIEIRNFNKDAWASTLEVLRGIYVERSNDYEPTPVMVQSIGSLSTTGRTKRSGEVNYPYVTKADLTLFLVSRDLAYASVPRFGLSALTTRDGATCLPGDVVLITESDYGFWGVPMVVNKVRKSPLKENHVLLTLEEYALPNNSPIYDTPEEPYDPGLDYSPKTPLGALAITAPFWIVSRARGVAYDSTSNVVYPLILPIPANDLQAYYDVHINNAPGVGQTQAQTGGLYATYGQLVNPISRWDGIENGQLTSIEIDSVTNPVVLDKVFSDNDQRSGRVLVFIGNEVFTYSSATQLAPDRYQLNLVKRGLIDTVPQDHAAGANVFITDNVVKNLVPVAFDYPLGYTPQWRVVSSTINERGKYANALAFASWNSANMPRTLRPVRPHDTRIDGVRGQAPLTLVVGEDYTVSWRTRNRSSPTIPFQGDTAELSEGTTDDKVIFHRVYLRDSTNTLRLCGETGDADNANSLVITIPPTVIDGVGTLFVRSVNQHGESLFDDPLPVEVWAGSSRIIRYAIEA